LNAIEVEADKIRAHLANALTDPRLATQRGSDERPRVEQSAEFHQRVVEARTPNREGRDRRESGRTRSDRKDFEELSSGMRFPGRILF
jgi:hypothetical protein